MLLPSGTAHRRPGLLRSGLLRAASLFLVLIALLLLADTAQAQTLVKTDIPGPPGSGSFGVQVVVLPNGNFVVTDPSFNAGVGAVDLYNGATLARISRLTGSAAGNQVGSSGVTVLANGHFVIRSPLWDNGGVLDVGAVTWGSSTAGVSGVVSPANSLIGSTVGDLVGDSVAALTNGNYVVLSPLWDDGATADVGAVTWGNGTGGIKGTISAANSLVGSEPQDRVGTGITPLPNGNYVVLSPMWDWPPFQNAGAVTWGSGETGITGTIDLNNSLVGNDTNFVVGNRGVTVLTNGNYVVNSVFSTSGIPNRGAVTWGSGISGVTGIVSSLNSLVGNQTNAAVGSGGVIALANGHYVVVSPEWSSDFDTRIGAVTWGNGITGTSGDVSSGNSLVGGKAGDLIGSGGVTALSNGDYVVSSPDWSSAVADRAGAATRVSGAGSTVGVVSTSNSLVGSAPGDQVSSGGVKPLTNGNFVVLSPLWNNGAVLAAGAATWVSGAGGTAGVVSAANSLVGDAADDKVSSGGVMPLANGNYVVSSPAWSNGAVLAAGAATWGNGASGLSGVVSPANSLVGTTAGDSVGEGKVTALTNGNYVVASPFWSNGGRAALGAVTWGSGATGIVGPVSATNSLVGSTALDLVGGGGVTALTNGNYVVNSFFWDNGAAADAGSVTWGSGTSGVKGVVTPANSLVGSTTDDLVGRVSSVALPTGDYVALSQDRSAGAEVTEMAVTWGSGTSGIVGPVSAANSVGGVFAAGFIRTFDFNSVHGVLLAGRPFDNIVTVIPPQFPLRVGKEGSGEGDVTANPSVIACGATCTAQVITGTVVTLTAAPAADSTFSGWSGACSGTGSCVVSMDAAQAVTATFPLKQFEVDLAAVGAGGRISVAVVSSPAAGSLGAANVAASYPIGTVLRLTAVPNPGFRFVAWGGAVTGSSNPVEVTVNGPLSITARFERTFSLYLPFVDR
jgi:hypothetical protein